MPLLVWVPHGRILLARVVMAKVLVASTACRQRWELREGLTSSLDLELHATLLHTHP